MNKKIMSKKKIYEEKIKKLEKTIRAQKIIISALIKYNEANKSAKDDTLDTMDYFVDDITNTSTSDELVNGNEIKEKYNTRRNNDPSELKIENSREEVKLNNEIEEENADESLGEIKSNKINQNEEGKISKSKRLKAKKVKEDTTKDSNKSENNEPCYISEEQKALGDAYENEIYSIINPETDLPMLFNENFTQREFIDYCATQGYTLYTNLFALKFTKEVTSFIETNRDALISYFLKNVNILPIKCSYSFLCTMRNFMDSNLKISFILNLMYELKDHLLLVYLLFPLTYNTAINLTVLGHSLKKIMEFQLDNNLKITTDKRIIEGLNHISVELDLSPGQNDLIKHIKSMIKSFQFDIRDPVDVCISEIYSLEIICMFYDWEWCYNHLIVDFIIPLRNKTNDIKYLFILGLIASIGLQLVGTTDSVMSIYEELLHIMQYGSFEDALVCYSFIQRVYPDFSTNWAIANKDKIQNTKLSEDSILNFSFTVNSLTFM
ncbi:hypothetical protein H312_00251 [Anncaliia algerae PRA339]|uniref:Uncharacterized protein n=1 Tax=Anncaliia algerae PRA339 TaxID=1288291 RepID=A0A059F4L9_9MICR|nr:hypothetical protein H312_00251 [Anncaliia algerae PRA339]